MGMERWGFLFFVMSSPIVYFLTTLLTVCPNINPTMLCAHVCDVNYAVCYLCEHLKWQQIECFLKRIHNAVAVMVAICLRIWINSYDGILVSKPQRRQRLSRQSIWRLQYYANACAGKKSMIGVKSVTHWWLIFKKSDKSVNVAVYEDRCWKFSPNSEKIS